MTYYSKNFKDEEGNFMYQKSPLKAIKHKCLYDCCAGDTTSWKECNATDCFLYPFRLGKNPYRTPRKLSEEQKAKMTAVLKAARENKIITNN